MSRVSVDYREILSQLWNYLELDEVKQSIVRLKGIDLNPFDEDGDEYVGVFAEMHHNWELIWDVALKLVAAVERVVVGGASLDNPEKHKIVVDLLDDLIRVPWFLEPFDHIVIDMIVKSAVKFLKAVNWGIELPPTVPAKIAFKEIG